MDFNLFLILISSLVNKSMEYIKLKKDKTSFSFNQLDGVIPCLSHFSFQVEGIILNQEDRKSHISDNNEL
jgi:hypothetical protein